MAPIEDLVSTGVCIINTVQELLNTVQGNSQRSVEFIDRSVYLVRAPVLDGPQVTPGVAVTFEPPVVNLPGDDVVLFEVQRSDSPAAGDAFHVGPLHWKPGLRGITVRASDITFGHPRAMTVAQYVPYLFRQPAKSLRDMMTQPLEKAFSPGGFKALPVGIDLAALGYAEGAAVQGLFFQDADSPGVRFDPVLIAGLPAPEPPNILEKIPELPECKTGNLLAKFLDGPMADLDEIVFAERIPGNDHWYANFGHYWCGRQEYPSQRLPEDGEPDPIFKAGGRLCMLNLRTAQLKVPLDDPAGGVRDPQVHYEGNKILFSYRKGGQPYYQLYEINTDGADPVQLTDGPCNDIEPTKGTGPICRNGPEGAAHQRSARQLDQSPFSMPLALRRAPSRIEPFADVPDILDFPRHVQPILDHHCVECHNPKQYDGRVDLTGDHTPLFSQSYWTIIQRSLIADGRNQPYGNRAPRTIGTGASRLLSFLDGTHYEAKLSDRDYTTVRLWIETSATYPGTYAALGSGMTTVEFPVAVMERRCGVCHGSPPNAKPVIGQGMYFTFGGAGPPLPLVHDLEDLKKIRGTMGYFKFGRSRTPQSLCNLIRPDKSLLVRAPLSG